MTSKNKRRMTAPDRKQAIIEAARPLFAQNGFHGTSVRDIARAADVSEALLYKHFPSKEAMYDEILDYAGAVSAATLDKLHNLEAGAETLVVQIYFLFRLILLEAPGLKDEQRWHERLLFHSLLGDARYARAHFANIRDILGNSIAACCEAAAEAGELTAVATGARNKMWFAHHLAMALNLCHVPDEPAFEYEGSKEELVEQAVLFCLRGMGMPESAVERYFQPHKLRAMFERSF